MPIQTTVRYPQHQSPITFSNIVPVPVNVNVHANANPNICNFYIQPQPVFVSPMRYVHQDSKIEMPNL